MSKKVKTFECKQCGTTINFRFGKSKTTSTVCPGCKTKWYCDQNGTPYKK